MDSLASYYVINCLNQICVELVTLIVEFARGKERVCGIVERRNMEHLTLVFELKSVLVLQ
jgi:hypothetical protein